jgi:hypothetical protein
MYAAVLVAMAGSAHVKNFVYASYHSITFLLPRKEPFRMRTITLLLIFTSLSPHGAAEKSAGLVLPAKRVERRSASPRATDTSRIIFEVFKDFNVPPGQSTGFDAVSDYAGAEKASVAIQCPSSTDLRNIQMQFLWTMEPAEFYAGTDFANGVGLAFTNMGGVVISVFGSSLHVEVKNSGTVPVSCNQLTIYAVVH